MRRQTPSLALLLLLASAQPVVAQTHGHNREALMHNALSAAPASVAAEAAVMLHSGEMLREGSNGFVCMPDDPAVPNNTPMCLDATWQELIDAWVNRREPHIERLGIAYMLQGDLPVSNIDPFATERTPENAWIQEGPPHIMIVTPDLASLDGLSADPFGGEPFVMWKGTPYAHIMVPTVPRPR